MFTFLLLLAMVQNPQDLYKAAIADMDAGRYSEAAARFEQILKDEPTHIPSEFNLAVCYTRTGNPGGAESLYRKIVEQDPTVYEAHINLGILLYDAASRLAEADEFFMNASHLRPQDAQPMLYHALILEKLGDLDTAATSYERAVQLDPKNGDTRAAATRFLVKRADEERRRGNLQKAIADLEAALALDSSNSAVQRRLGLVYREAGQFDKAIDVLAPLGIRGSEEDLDLALTYFAKKDYARAAAVFDLLAAKDPSNADYHYMLGKSLMETKQYGKAAVSLLAALKLKPADTEALSSLASTYQLQEDWAHAVPVIERFIQMKPKDAFAYFMLGSCYDRLGNFRQALLNYNKFLALDDGSSDVRSFQARQRAKTLDQRLKKP